MGLITTTVSGKKENEEISIRYTDVQTLLENENLINFSFYFVGFERKKKIEEFLNLLPPFFFP